eukprot:COSAG03_NODE_22749_length_287_cov_1.042553_1_plen_38_part_10
MQTMYVKNVCVSAIHADRRKYSPTMWSAWFAGAVNPSR